MIESAEEGRTIKTYLIIECLDFSQVDKTDIMRFNLAFSNVVIHWIASIAYQKMFALLLPNGGICVELCEKFKNRVREKFRIEKTPAHAHTDYV